MIESELISVEEYLAGEMESEVRHEYFGGVVRAMAGASDRHEQVSMNLAVALHTHLKGGPCQVFKDGMKLRLEVNKADVFYYPDVMVACDPTDDQRYFRERPTLVVEVLSEDVNRDRVDKYLAYGRVEALQEYVIISQDPAAPRVEVFRKDGRADWELVAEVSEGEFALASVDFTMAVAELYA